jgi:hypothetical protein
VVSGHNYFSFVNLKMSFFVVEGDMKALVKVMVLLSILIFCSSVFAVPNAWLNTTYTQYSPSHYTSSYRSPVTGGYLDILVFVDNVTFTDLDFSIIYDTNTVQEIGTGSVTNIISGLTVSGAATVDLDGSWKKTTISLSGDVTVGELPYQSNALFRVRFLPVAEGTMAVGLWSDSSPKYPASYTTCSLSVEDDGVPVSYERNEWNDSTELFTFTDKAPVTLLYEYDNNFGNPITNGFLRVVYDDDSVQDFHVSDHASGITVANPFGGYFITPQAGAVSYSLIFPEYWEIGSIYLNGGRSISHSQPEGFFEIQELMEGFNHTLPTSANDVTLTILQDGIGIDFSSHQYGAALAGETAGVVDKTFTIDANDDDSIKVTIAGGLEADYYNLYIYKDSLILGGSWFGAAEYYDVTFNVTDQNSIPLSGAKILLPKYGWQGLTNIIEVTDANGQAKYELPGDSEGISYYDFHATNSGYENVDDSFEVLDADVSVPVVMSVAEGVDFTDFTGLGTWWNNQYCDSYSNGNCSGFDYNYDETVDFKDMEIFAERWLKD